MSKILTSAMDNVTAYKLGRVGLNLEKYPREKIGDEIDRGLVLRRLLEEAGFGLVELSKDTCMCERVFYVVAVETNCPVHGLPSIKEK